MKNIYTIKYYAKGWINGQGFTYETQLESCEDVELDLNTVERDKAKLFDWILDGMDDERIEAMADENNPEDTLIIARIYKARDDDEDDAIKSVDCFVSELADAYLSHR